MSTPQLTQVRRMKRSSAGGTGELDAGLRNIFAAISAWCQKIADARHLKELPDYLLDDIGIDRSQIDRACHTGITPRRLAR